MKKPEIQPENSAQGTDSKPNPLVQPMLERLTTEKGFGLRQGIKLVDLGCGKLRHLRICKNYAKQIVLVDTKRQIERVQKFGKQMGTMSQYISSTHDTNVKIAVVTIDDFERQQHNADVVLSIAVMDVVLKDARIQVTRTAFRNLRAGGYFVVIVPRNDGSLLVNCKIANKYEDGFVFRNRGHDTLTFYSNFRDPSPLLALLTANGFELLEDHSVFRQICWILRRP